ARAAEPALAQLRGRRAAGRGRLVHDPGRPAGQGPRRVAAGQGGGAARRAAGHPGRVTMDFRETAEQVMLREAVAKIAADYGHDYFAAKARAGEKTTELWRAVGHAGGVGGELPAPRPGARQGAA